MEIWDVIASERRALADDLDALDDGQWAQPSLCAGWTVKATAAHLTVIFHVPVRTLLWKALLARGFDKAMMKIANDEADGRSTTDIITELRANAGNRFVPPSMTATAPLTDIVVHGQDIRRALGVAHSFPEDALRPVLDLLVSKKGKFARPAGGIEGLRFEATDIDWSSGQGPVVSGTGEALGVAISGRAAAVDELAGDGAAEFATRF